MQRVQCHAHGSGSFSWRHWPLSALRQSDHVPCCTATDADISVPNAAAPCATSAAASWADPVSHSYSDAAVPGHSNAGAARAASLGTTHQPHPRTACHAECSSIWNGQHPGASRSRSGSSIPAATTTAATGIPRCRWNVATAAPGPRPSNPGFALGWARFNSSCWPESRHPDSPGIVASAPT